MFYVPYQTHTDFRRLQSKRGKNYLLDSSLLARLAAQMLSFQDIPAVVSSVKLLRCIAATESAAVVPFVESKQFCESASMFSRSPASSALGALFIHFCSKANLVISENDKNSENILFSFWKGLGLLLRYKPSAVESASLREAYCDTWIQLVQQYNCSAGAHILCAQSFSMIAKMYPASIFLGQQECDILSKISVSRNEQVKVAVLKLIEGRPVHNHITHALCFHTPLRYCNRCRAFSWSHLYMFTIHQLSCRIAHWPTYYGVVPNVFCFQKFSKSRFGIRRLCLPGAR